jgi:hypothetical protein
MSYSIAVSEGGDFLSVRVEGAFTVEEARKFAAESHAESQKTGIPHFLFDMREARNAASTDSNYLFARHDMDRLGISREARAAILKSPSDDSHDFVEQTMRDAGFNVRSFTDHDAAAAWLRGESSGP